MDFIKKITVNTGKYRIRKVFLCGLPLYEYIKINRYNKKTKAKKTYKFYSLRGFAKQQKSQRVFYLKVHRVHRTSFDCIRQWVNVAGEMNAFIYFVCDNPEMQREILNRIKFPNKNFKFIKSDRKTIKTQIQKILHNVERQALWERIAFSMMTPFIHAVKNKTQISYNIDADDILLCIEPKKIRDAFLKAEEYAYLKKLDLFNIDMFLSKSFGVHWSFGVVLCTNPQKCLDVVKRNTNWRENKKLINEYKICWLDKFNFNVDWLFTFLRDTKQLNMGTFCINNALVAHMPDIILEHGWAFMLKWKDNNAYFPILQQLYLRKVWDSVPIPTNCCIINVDLSEDDYKKFLCKFYDFGVGFELDMLEYAKHRDLISSNLYQKYATTPQFIRECGWRKDIEELKGDKIGK